MARWRIPLDRLGALHDLARDRRWTPAELCAAFAARRERLAAAGVGPGTRVVIAHGGTPEFFADLFAVWSLEACAACVNGALTDAELLNVVEFTAPAALIAGERGPPDGLAAEVAVVDGLAAPTGSVGGSVTLDCPAAMPALILFTSGTTGDPKGVVHACASLRARVEHNHRYIARDTLARSLCVLPTHFGHGLIGNCLTPLLAGGTLLLASGGGIGVPARLGAILDAHAVTFMSSVPSFWRLALKMSAPPALGSLRQVNVGSAPVAAELVHAIGAWSGTGDVRNMYGITETANWVAGSSTLERAPADGLIGTMWGGEAAVLLADGELAKAGAGELMLRPPALMSGYFRRPDLTADVLRDGWYRTGDLGALDANGVIRLSGRLKDEINRGGIKVSPAEVDLLLERHPDVVEACTFALPDAVAGEIVGAAIRLTADGARTAEELRHWCGERIRRECIPERWFFVAEIPRTDRGKLNRAVVREACLRETQP
jgi:oxalate---CoA ligase